VADLAPLAGLTALQTLTCRGFRIATFPESLFDRPLLEFLVLYDGTLGDVPAEGLSQSLANNCLPRLRAHLRDLRAGAEPMRDARLLVLGNGRVGKTQLCRRRSASPTTRPLRPPPTASPSAPGR
jgi:internalin A